MDNNFNNGYGQPQMQQPYGQPMQQPYGQPMQQPYGQPMQQQYAQPMQQYAQPMQQYGAPKKQFAGGDIINDFMNKVKGMGISLYGLLGLIGAMLLIFTPFMNFATVHVSGKPEHVKVKAADGMNLFELSKLSGSIDSTIDLYNTAMKKAKSLAALAGGDVDDILDDLEDEIRWETGMRVDLSDLKKIDKNDICDLIDDAVDYADDYADDIEDETDMKVGGSIKEIAGLTHLAIKGRLPLLITPILFIICGLGLFVGSLLENKMFKLIFAGVPAVGLIWLMICSSHFFAMAGFGVLTLVCGIGLGIASAILEK